MRTKNNELLTKRLANLLTVKSLLTIGLFIVVAIQVLRNIPVDNELMELFKIVIIFYFGVQYEKRERQQ